MPRERQRHKVAKIHPEVLEKLQRRLGVRDSRVYDLISKRAGETGLPRHLAALKVAAENGININKKAYATDEERARLAGVPLPSRTSLTTAVVEAQTAARKPSKGKPR